MWRYGLHHWHRTLVKKKPDKFNLCIEGASLYQQRMQLLQWMIGASDAFTISSLTSDPDISKENNPSLPVQGLSVGSTGVPLTPTPLRTLTQFHYSSEVMASAVKYSSPYNEGCIDLYSSVVGSEEAEGRKTIPHIILLCFISSAHLHSLLIRLSCMETEAAAPTHRRLDVSCYR